MTVRRPADVRPPVPEAVQARWRAVGAWTDETLLDRFLASPARFGGDTAVVDGDVRLDRAEVVERARRVAGYLAGVGVRAGDVVAWQLPNWWEAIVVAWGCLLAGAVPSPITPTLREREVGFVLRQSDARLVIVPREFRGTDHVALVRATGYDGPVLVVRGEPTAAGEVAFDDALRAPSVEPATVAVDDPAVVLWTSGTTADPKGVVHSHQGLRHEADSIAAAHLMQPGEALLLPMPCTHVSALTYGVLLPFTTGIRAVLMDRWDPGDGLRLLAAERVAVMISTPVFLRGMADHPTFAEADTSSLRLFSLGGAGVAPSMVREGAARFGAGGCWCKRTYGSTEYPTLSTGHPDDGPELDATTDGRLIGPAEVRVVDPGREEELPTGESGELWVRGPEMAWGYLDGELDASAFTSDGWFRTGDLATYDGTHLTIVDRLKDVIIRGGENVSAAEVEALLVAHPDVAEAACVAVPDPVVGERVCAYVIAAPGRTVTLRLLTDHLRGLGLATFKLPERLELRESLPRTASGKVQKAPLRTEAASLAAGER